MGGLYPDPWLPNFSLYGLGGNLSPKDGSRKHRKPGSCDTTLGLGPARVVETKALSQWALASGCLRKQGM